MTAFLAPEDQRILDRHGLNDFEALWNLQLKTIDESNTGRGGWSSVFRFELPERAYYLKRQCNHLTHTLKHPFGEPTFAREFRNIQRYHELGIPVLEVAYFAQRKIGPDRQAMLMTRALDDWRDLDGWMRDWHEMPPEQCDAIIVAVGLLARRLHQAGQMHGCFYPKHIFLRPAQEMFEACLIDLEKTRPLWFGRRDQVKDLEPLLRRTPYWRDQDVRLMLGAYLKMPADSEAVSDWFDLLCKRRNDKEKRG